MENCFNIHKNSNADQNPHYLFCEELMIPMMNRCDSQRINLFSNHLNQLVHLVTPEIPKVFTNFENQVGEYSTAIKKASDDFAIIDKIVKNKYNYDLLIQYKDSGVYDLLHYRTGYSLANEDYGVHLEDCLKDKKVGDTIKKGEILMKSPNYDEEGNFMYGVNLKIVYLPYKLLTYEDGLVISKSAAKKLSSYKTEETTVSVNTNDILLNLYGEKNQYKSIPLIGEKIKNKILVASRRIDNSKSLYEFQSDKLSVVDKENDTLVYTSGGTVVDINIYANTSIETLRSKNNEFSNEVADLLEEQYKYYGRLKEALEKIMPVVDKTKVKSVLKEKNGNEHMMSEADLENKVYGHIYESPISRDQNPNKYTDELAFYWKLAHEMLDPKIEWRDDGKSFDNFKIKFTILKENPLTPGCKLSGRYGNKSVVSLIEDDDRMPITEDGTRADVCENVLGVINRLNPSQIFETYINFMSDNLLKYIKDKPLKEKEEEYFYYLGKLNPKQMEFIKNKYEQCSEEEKIEYFEDLQKNGIYVHEPPYFGNTDIEQFIEIFKEKPYLVKRLKCFYMGQKIERDLVMGDLYFIRLKHESSNKSSVRSTGFTNVKRLPSKSTLKKEKKLLVSQTPIRLGEMETTNLLIAKRPDLLRKLLRTYSTNEKDRSNLVEDIISAENPFEMDINLTNEEPTINKEILDKYLEILDLKIESD